MVQITLLYFSGTGNTQAVANWIAEGLQRRGAQVQVRALKM